MSIIVNGGGKPKEEILPIELGGTGADLSGAATNAVVCKASSGQTLTTVSTAKGAFYATGANATPKFGTLPIAEGGTGATSASAARTNLGFTYGTAEPTGTPTTGEGSVYFMEDDGTPLSIAEGGTGADTVSGVLNNLGLSNALKIQTVSPSDWTVPANSARGGEIKGTIDGYEGYTPIVFACYCINAYGVLIINAWVSGSYDSAGGGFTWNIDARNVTSSSVTANFTLRILWIKDNVM